jgi:hypothetical protein
MALLRIQHTVPDFDAWKRMFDSDPADRKGSGVTWYRVHRGTADPLLVTVDLDFDTPGEAEAMLKRLRAVWDGPGRDVMSDVQAWVFDTVESAKP